MKLNAVNQSSVTMVMRVQIYHMGYQTKGKDQFYQIVPLDLQNGQYPTSEKS